MYLHRTVEQSLPSLCQNFKVILISGMRKVGKRTLLQYLATNDRKYVSLGKFEDYELALTSPSAFFRQHQLPLIIDEIQRVPQLFRQVKAEVDKSDACSQVWLSGSQRFSLMQNVGDSLAGRIFEVHLMPLSIYERDGKGLLQSNYVPSEDLKNHLDLRSPSETWDIIWQGAWPELYRANSNGRSQFFEAFIQTLLERDIQTDRKIGKLAEFRKFLKALAMCTAQELRINKLSKLSGVTEPTVKRWLEVAQAIGLIYLLQPFSSDRSKTLTKSPKVYFCDTGLAAYLCGFSTANQMQRDTNAGAFFKTFVVTEILKSWYHNSIKPEMYYYRDAKKNTNVDLIIHANGLYHPVQVCMCEQPNISMARHFSELDNLGLKRGFGAVICNCPSHRYLSDNVIAHSIWQI